ncbi:MAG: S-layer homology domain-containing protein, partial [Clostridia bacterium]|nr:S-layer homology domain-containing protein [Clostridia bacterium]
GNTIAQLDILKNSDKLDVKVNGTVLGNCPKDTWFNLVFDFDTEQLNFDVSIGGVKLNTTPISFKTTSGTNFRPDIAWVGFHIEQAEGKNVLGTWYVDDLCVWTDESEALNTAAAELSAEDITSESLDGVTQNLTLPAAVGEYAVKWSSDNPCVNTQDGAVTRGNCSQNVLLTAQLCAQEDESIVQSPSVTKTFNLTILPNDGVSDSDVINAVKESFLTDERISTVPLDQITRILRTLPTQGPDGVQISWSAGESSYVTDDGLITQPEAGEPNHNATLTATLTKGSATDTKAFNLTVLAKPDGAALAKIAKGKLTLEMLTDDPASSIKHKLYLVKELDGVSITYSSTNPAALDENGNVRRIGEKVPLTFTVHYSYGGVELDTEEFELVIAKSIEISMDEDLAAISLDETQAVTSDLYLPTKGSVNELTIAWTSSDTSLILFVESTQKGMVYRPDNVADNPENGGDKTVTLTATIKAESKTKTRKFTLTVMQLPSDSELVSTAAASIIWDSISIEEKDAVTRNLALQTEFPDGVTAKWSFSPQGVVDEDGFVNNPLPGEEPVEVTLNATVKKRESSVDITPFVITVQPFSSEEDILKKAKDALSFSVISDEPIQSVTKDLRLVEEWKLGSSVSWSSSSGAVSMGADSEGNLKGIVNRPPYGSGVSTDTLTATISKDGKTVSKKFIITILQEETYKELFRHTYDVAELTIGSSPRYDDGGKWNSVPNTTPTTIQYDPLNGSNKVLNFFKAQGEVNPWDKAGITRSLLYYFPTAGEGNLVFGGKFYMPQNETENFYDANFFFEIMGPGGSQVPIYMCKDGKLGFNINEQGVAKKIYTKEGVFERDRWVNFTVEINTPSMRYNVFIEGECVTEDGEVEYNGKDYSTWSGVPYVKAETTSTPTISGIRLSMIYEKSDEGDSNFYLDDLYLLQKNELPSNAVSSYNSFEQEFLSKNKLSALDTDLVFPQALGAESFSYSSGDTSVIKADGTILQGTQSQSTTFTVRMTLVDDVIEKTYNVTVMPITAASAVSKDLTELIATLKANHNLSSLTENITIPVIGNYGSNIRAEIIEGDASAIDSNGKISRGSSDKTVKMQITVTNGTESDSEILEITVKAQSQLSVKEETYVNSGSTSSVVYGSGVNNNSGIKLPENDEPAKMQFNDLDEQHWAYSAIEALWKEGIMKGTGYSKVEPERTVTRAEFAKLLASVLNVRPSGGSVKFSDVPQTHWGYQYIRTLASNGIINGQAEGYFGANANVSRQDMAVMIYRALAAEGISLDAVRSSPEFSDSAQISIYAKDAVSKLYSYGIINGISEWEFSPNASATRAQAAKVIYEFLKGGAR